MQKNSTLVQTSLSCATDSDSGDESDMIGISEKEAAHTVLLLVTARVSPEKEVSFDVVVVGNSK
jgi:hypothetical protein